MATLTQSVISFFVKVERIICLTTNPENSSDTTKSPAKTTYRLS